MRRASIRNIVNNQINELRKSNCNRNETYQSFMVNRIEAKMHQKYEGLHFKIIDKGKEFSTATMVHLKDFTNNPVWEMNDFVIKTSLENYTIEL